MTNVNRTRTASSPYDVRYGMQRRPRTRRDAYFSSNRGISSTRLHGRVR